MGNQGGVIRYCAHCYATFLPEEKICDYCLRRNIIEDSFELGPEVDPETVLPDEDSFYVLKKGTCIRKH